MSEKITISVDTKSMVVEKGAMLLDILRERGMDIPTLCEHPSLPPNGACRLCTVEITKADWHGWSKLVTSCLYPAEADLQVFTRSERVLKLRRGLLEMYLAQCPQSEEVRELARSEGVDASSFPLNENENRCVLCGLCVRVCQDLGPAALSSLGRGTAKEVGPRPDGLGEDCTGCGACAYICPTHAIPYKYENQKLTIWKREFEVPVCSVTPEACRGCGICEEVCPYSIPRVTLYPTGLTVSQIAASACVGCGICKGACPAGAIRQKNLLRFDSDEAIASQTDFRGKTVVFACSRSPFPSGFTDVVRVPCIGSVPVETILGCLVKGADGVALMCRDRGSCPFHAGGDLGETRLNRVGELCELVGLGRARVGLLTPAPGQQGPYEAAMSFQQKVSASPLAAIYSSNNKISTGMDAALDIISWLRDRPELHPQLTARIQRIFEPLSGEATTLFYLGNLPELDLLLAACLPEWRLTDLLRDAVEILRVNEIKAKPVFTRSEVENSRANRIIVFSKGDLDIKGKEIVTVDELAKTASAPAAASGFSFRLSAKERLRLLKKIKSAGSTLVCHDARELAQFKLLLRRGAWTQVAGKTVAMGFSAKLDPQEASGENEAQHRIQCHPILPPLEEASINFTFDGRVIKARAGEVVSSALYASGITVFGHQPKDGGAQGIFCVNGQCSQCMVMADGRPVKSCMTPVVEGMAVESLKGLPRLSDSEPAAVSPDVEDVNVEVLIVGGGPAGICAAIELGHLGVNVLIVDDKQELGGKLSLQTHNFFGSVKDCYAGERGVQIGHTLAAEVQRLPTVKIWLNSTVLGVFSDGKFGVLTDRVYRLVTPKRVLMSSGAREKSLSFPGCDLPGVYGAGAFQTLVNRDQVRCAERLFIIGGGNVGLIGAYHALQAGIDVVGLVEALPRCGGYKVHEDKIRRLGVPVWTSHTVLRIEGHDKVERVVIAAIDDKFQPVKGSERVFEVDTVLIAVGLSPVDELLKKTRQYGMKIFAAGDAEEIAEASAAIFSGKIIGRKIAQDMGMDIPIPSDWEEFGQILKHHAGAAVPFKPENIQAKVFPLLRCVQEIPCDPCTQACPKNLITKKGSILSLPEFSGECLGCGRCVLACPGLAINLVINDYDPSGQRALLMLPFEFNDDKITLGAEVITTDMEGGVVGKGKVIALRARESQNKRKLLFLEVPEGDKLNVAGFRIRDIVDGTPLSSRVDEEEDPIVCRCERVRKSEIVNAIRAGVRDMNQLKAVVRAGLGGCNGKTCTDLIVRLFRQEGVALSEITLPTTRPLVAEVPLGDFVKKERTEGK